MLHFFLSHSNNGCHYANISGQLPDAQAITDKLISPTIAASFSLFLFRNLICSPSATQKYYLSPTCPILSLLFFLIRFSYVQTLLRLALIPFFFFLFPPPLRCLPAYRNSIVHVFFSFFGQPHFLDLTLNPVQCHSVRKNFFPPTHTFLMTRQNTQTSVNS